MGFERPLGLELQTGDWEVPVQLIHWKGLFQSLLPSSTASSSWEQEEAAGPGLPTVLGLPSSLLLFSCGTTQISFGFQLLLIPYLHLVSEAISLTLSLKCIAQVSHQPHPPFPE